MQQNVNKKYQDLNKKSLFLLHFLTEHIHLWGTFMDHVTGTILLYNMGALNMKSGLFDIRTA